MVNKYHIINKNHLNQRKYKKVIKIYFFYNFGGSVGFLNITAPSPHCAIYDNFINDNIIYKNHGYNRTDFH